MMGEQLRGLASRARWQEIDTGLADNDFRYACFDDGVLCMLEARHGPNKLQSTVHANQKSAKQPWGAGDAPAARGGAKGADHVLGCVPARRAGGLPGGIWRV
jgi:hypothetical protein